jgi:hypothetical protein
MDKKRLEITAVHAGNDRSYWKQKSYAERIEALEILRRIVFGYDLSTTRLQRVITITELKEN